ncbi:protein-L-isoaspartate(D-aspartate) O-methyltransferase [candidate division TA06 bacterium]|uniref:Protein-L-isoaspartate O-methyltransferase n=1 Tax=candidate division TA06 bacterium TaxID=2250710 RepID=A0A523UYX4_UNCT6|nr:MAG: protein-L-isoaspartate(D-aspartate) O-methyltransferase [candidate division TA06 bacterium]
MRFEGLRNKMVSTQIESRGVKDKHVLKAMRKVPRHIFVEEALWERAYDDHPLPIGQGQTISQPYMVGSMTEALELKGKGKVLEIGTGSGYQTAILAEIAEQVFTIERIEELLKKARRTLDRLGYANVVFRVGDGTIGWQDQAPFDAILVAAGAPDVPEYLFEQLAEGGRMAVPIGDVHGQTLVVIKKEAGKQVKTTHFGCVFVPLIGKNGWPE